MSREIKNGRWFSVETEEQFNLFRKYGQLKEDSFGGARATMGTYEGPGEYYLLQYCKPCPRGCCQDDVNEVLSPDDVISEVKDEIRELAYTLRDARQKSNGGE